MTKIKITIGIDFPGDINKLQMEHLKDICSREFGVSKEKIEVEIK